MALEVFSEIGKHSGLESNIDSAETFTHTFIDMGDE